MNADHKILAGDMNDVPENTEPLITAANYIYDPAKLQEIIKDENPLK